MPALVKSRLGESGIRLDEGTIVWPFDLKNSKNDCLISADFIYFDKDPPDYAFFRSDPQELIHYKFHNI